MRLIKVDVESAETSGVFHDQDHGKKEEFTEAESSDRYGPRDR